MKKSTMTIIIAVLAVLLIGGVIYATTKSDDDNTTTTTTPPTSNTSTTPPADNSTGTDNGTTPSESSSVTIQDYSFNPTTITVKKGTKVTWTNQDTVEHTVTPDTATDDFKSSDLFGKGESYSVTFNTPGTFSYYCKPHPYMKGNVVVTE